MNNDNKALFVFGFLFYFIGDLTTTYIALNKGLEDGGLIKIIGSPNILDMLIVKAVFFVALYLLIAYLEKRNQNYLCGAVLGLIAGMGMTMT